MEIDYTKPEAGSHQAPEVPSQRAKPPSMPVRVWPTPEPKPARKPRRWGLLLGSVAALAVVIGLGTWLLQLPGSIENAQVGDCASFDRSNPQSPYATVSCGSSAAAFTVLQVIDGNGNCREVPGATRSTVKNRDNTRREVCMGPKDANPAEALNVAQVGDCLTGTSGQERRVPCTDSSANLQILERFNNLSNTQVSTACDRVPNATSVFAWSWDSDDGTGPAMGSFQTDAVFCLGPITR